MLFNSATVHRHTCVAPTLNTWTRMLFPMVCDNNAQQPSEHPHFASPINLPSSNEARNERDDCGHFYSFPHPRSPINHSCVLSSHSNTRGKTCFKVVPFLLRFYFVPSLSLSLSFTSSVQFESSKFDCMPYSQHKLTQLLRPSSYPQLNKTIRATFSAQRVFFVYSYPCCVYS